MENNKNRPVYLNLLKIRLPIGGMVSVIHRITGALLALLLPFALYLLQRSLLEPTAFADIAAHLATPAGRVLLLGILWVFAQHFFSGVRHLLQDIGVGVEKAVARRGAWLTFTMSILVVVLTGICL